MRLSIVHDRDGRILAAADLDADDPDGATPRPVAVNPEHTTIELDVPNEYQQGDLREICERLRVDPERRQLVPRETSA
jgi:hypothetical protein